MGRVYTEKKDDRKNKVYGRRVSIHLPDCSIDIHERVMKCEDFKSLHMRLSDLARTISDTSNTATQKAWVKVSFDYPNGYSVRFFFRADRPKEILDEATAIRFGESVVPVFEEVIRRYKHEVEGLNGIAKTEAEADHIVSQLVIDARTAAKKMINYAHRLACLEKDLVGATELKMGEYVTGIRGKGISYEDDRKASDRVVELVVEKAPEAAKKPQEKFPFSR